MSKDIDSTTPRSVSRWARAALCVAVALPLATLAACGKKADEPAATTTPAADTTPAPAPAAMPSAPSADASMPDAGASSPATAASDPMSAMPAASTASMP